MKSILSLVLIIASCHCLYSQNDWDLSPLGQKTYFRFQDELKLHYNDSIEVWNGWTTHYYGAKYYFQDYGFCWFDVLEFLSDVNYPFPHPDVFLPPASNDEYYVDLNEDPNFKFYHSAPVGFTWVVPGGGQGSASKYQFSCDTIQELTFLNYTDSVKTYSIQALDFNSNPITHPLNDFQFKLSKEAGFIEFIPFDYFSDFPNNQELDTWKIVGFKKDTIYGFMNQFEDYFYHFQVGDIYKWHQIGGSVFIGDTETWMWDSITQVNITNDLVEIKFNRTQLQHRIDTSGHESWTFTEKTDLINEYARSDYEGYFQSATQWPSIQLDLDFFWDISHFWDHTPVFHGNSVVEYARTLNYRAIDLDDCSIGNSFDWYRETSMQTEVGVITNYKGGYPEHWTKDTLVCYIKDGIEYGEDCERVEFFTSISDSELLKEKFYSIYPNPATNYLHIDFNSLTNKNITFQIFDNYGNLLKEFVKQEMRKTQELNLKEFAKGIYFLKVNTENEVGISKFMIQ